MPAPPPHPAPGWSETALGALLATLERPDHWVVSLAGFLARGGVLLFLLPITVLPTPAGLQADLSPLLVPLVFGQLSPGLVLLGAALVGLAALWVVVGGLVGAWADRLVALDLASGAAPPPDRRGRVVPLVCAARLLAHLPLGLALAWGAVPIAQSAYDELVTPFEVVTPLVVRIVSTVPGALAVVLLTWLLGEAAGGLAAREVALGGRSVVDATLRGWLALARRPIAGVATTGLGTLMVLLAVAPALVAAGVAWGSARYLLFSDVSGPELALALLAFVSLWLGGLVLAGMATTFRAALWTGEWLRQRPQPALRGPRHGSDPSVV